MFLECEEGVILCFKIRDRIGSTRVFTPALCERNIRVRVKKLLSCNRR